MKKWFWLLILLLFLGQPMRAGAAETSSLGEVNGFLDELNLKDIEETLEQVLDDSDVTFKDMLWQLVKGEIPFTLENVSGLFGNTILSHLGQYKKVALQILVVVLAGAVFTNFTNVFDKNQIADISFYMMYLLMFTILMNSFWDLSQLTADTLEKVLTFMKVLLPTYFVVATFASGSLTAAGFYELTLILITVIQWLMKYLLLPGVNLYVLFLLLNHLSKEEYLSKMADLMKTFISWMLKTLLGVVIGFQTVQCLIMPAVDGLKNTILHKGSGAIPVIGTIFNAVSEVVIGSAVLLKNAVGVAGLIIILIICLMPLIRLLVFTFLYKLLAAVSQPISDKRMVECIGSVGEGVAMLMRIVFTTGALFLITLAMVTASIKGL